MRQRCRLGRSVRIVVLDNLREGRTPNIYDATLNPLYRDVLLPCRVNDQDRKGNVEAGVGHAKRTPLKGQPFESWSKHKLWYGVDVCISNSVIPRQQQLVLLGFTLVTRKSESFSFRM